jgi:hypothetical protein
MFVKTGTIHGLKEKSAATLPGGFAWVTGFTIKDRQKLRAAPIAGVFVLRQKRNTTNGLWLVPRIARVENMSMAFCAAQWNWQVK